MQDDNSETPGWLLPVPGYHAHEYDARRMIIENWNIELQILIEQMCARDGDLNPDPDYSWRSAKEDMDRVLSAQGCEYIRVSTQFPADVYRREGAAVAPGSQIDSCRSSVSLLPSI